MNTSNQSPHPIAELFLGNRHLLVLFVVVSMVGGISALQGLPRLEDPVIANRNPIIVTLYPGASASRVESLVTEKIEVELKEVPEIKNLDSTSRAGVSLIAVELADKVTAQTNQQVFSKIRDRLADAANEFPEGVLPPQFDDMRGAVAYTLVIALRADDEHAAPPLTVLSRLAEELANRLRNLGGTELVRVYGDADFEIAVTVDETRLTARGLTLADVAGALESADAKVPSGFLRGEMSGIVIETSGELSDLTRVRDVPIMTSPDGGRVVRVGDVATVERAYRDPPSEIATQNGTRAVLVAARVQPDVRVDQWATGARRAVAEFEDLIGGGIAVETVFDQGDYTSARLQDLSNNLLLGGLVVMLVVVVTMGWRSSLIVGLALPVTAALSLFVIALMGEKLHQMSIFGMIIALGLLIDNAIVMTDEVRKGLAGGFGPVEAFSRALRHLFFPLLSSTLTTMLTFLPILLLPGGVGDFVGSIASSVIVALGASFLVATTVIGAVAALFSRAATGGPGGRLAWLAEGIQVRWLARPIRAALLLAVRRPLVGVGVSLVIPLAGFLAAGTLGSQFFPRTDRNMFEVEVWLPTEASIDETHRMVREIESLIRKRDGVTGVSWMVGGSYPSVYYNLIMNNDDSPHYAHGIVTTTSFDAVSEMIPALQAEIDRRFPGAQVVVTRFAQGPPADADVEFRISGPAVETLQDLGEQARRVLAGHPGILQTQVTMPRGEPKLWLRSDEKAARFAGLPLTEIAGQLQGMLEGATGGTLVEAFDEMPVRVRYAKQRREQIENLRELNLRPTGGGGATANVNADWIPLSAMGTFELEPELGGITRRNGIRTNKVYGFARPDALAIDIARQVQAKLEQGGFSLPPGYHFAVGGESENQAEAVGNLMLYLPVIVVMTIALLVLSFRNVRIAIILLLAAPLSLGFGLLATWAMHFPLSFNTIIGSMGLMGLAFNSSIVVIAAIRGEAKAAGGDPEAIVEAVLGSGRHLVSTTLTTMGSFLPLLIFIGGEFWPPLAIVLAGGVGGSTLLAVAFAPALYRTMLTRRERESPGQTNKNHKEQS